MSDPVVRPLTELHDFYRQHLLDHVIPFYLPRILDTKHGGYTNCLDNDGNLLSTDKYIWSQGRGVWTFSAIYNRIAREQRFLDAARVAVDFLKKHGRDNQGRWAFRVSQAGEILDGPISIYSDLFVTLGLAEYYRASGDLDALRLAHRTFQQAWERIQSPGFDAVAPFQIKKGWRIHGVPMIMLDIAMELERSVDDPEIDRCLGWCVDSILNYHYQPEYGLIFEYVYQDGGRIEGPEGRIVNPGHIIECMWFLMHYGMRKERKDLVEQACQLICTALEVGWDKEFGGLFGAIDAETGRPSPAVPNSEKKPWWPETEALYALLLVHEFQGKAWAAQWYWKIHEWAMEHLVCPKGDWYQRLDREGNPIDTVVALPVKDPYHLPRALILGYQSLSRQKGINNVHDPFQSFLKVSLKTL